MHHRLYSSYTRVPTLLLAAADVDPRMDRTQISADQVNEFSEYASLVRSIRVENTTELAWKLLATPDVDDDDDEDDLGEEGAPGSSRRSKNIKTHGANGNGGESEISYDSKNSTPSKLDARWPLGPDEVVLPKWHLQDEILSFARRTVPRNPLSGDKTRQVLIGDQGQLENDILQPIPEMIKDMLVFVVDLMAVHIPPITDSLHDRIRPLGWEHVINVLSASLHCKDQGPLTSE